MTQSTPLDGNIRYLPAPCPYSKEDTKVERVGHGQGRLGRRNGDPWFWRWWGDGDHEPIWGHVLSHIWSDFWYVELVRPRRNVGRISHFRCAETTTFHQLFIVQIDVPRIFPKPFHDYATNTPRLKWVFYVTRLHAAAGIKQEYRLINVAPI